jgi:UDP-N-acetylmuramoyl-tripeptide--D-alanyl-D-alanine ligase
VQGDNVHFGAVLSDTRTIQPGALFVALRGDRFDGHDFVPDAAAHGAAAALVSRPVQAPIPQVIVSDTLTGLSAFASAWRRYHGARVVGVTGSNGKTTVKEMLGAILSRVGPCLVTQGNLNNHIGVPLTLCRLEDSHRYAVIEMGASHQHEIAHLAAIAEPDVGLVINAGPAHLEGFGGIEGVAKGKGEMYAALDTSGVAIINADDRFAAFWHGLARAAGTVITFGMRERADIGASRVVARQSTSGFVTEFDLRTLQGDCRVALPLAGEHNVMNALAAAAAAMGAGADLGAVQKGLQSMRPVAGRLETKAALNGARLIDDAYNANPGSVRAGLRALAELPGERWLILGEMAELGEDTSRLHAEIGEFARQTGFSRLYAIGGEARHAVEAFGPGASWFASADEMVAAVKPGLKPGLTVLVKGSRVNRLERVTAALAAQGRQPAAGGH